MVGEEVTHHLIAQFPVAEAHSVVVAGTVWLCASPGVVPDFVPRSTDNTAVIAIVRAGVGQAVLPLLAVERMA